MYFSSNALARKIEKLAQESWKPAGLSPSHAYLLILVLEMPGVQPTTLTGHLQLTPSTITRLIEKLEEQKLVTRNYKGKTTFVTPTTRAKQMQPLLLQCQEHFYNSYSTVLGKEASAKLVDAINTVADKLQDV
jgi:MarR family transcriptional regulator, organic hydroperoxide resistance regulator